MVNTVVLTEKEVRFFWIINNQEKQIEQMMPVATTRGPMSNKAQEFKNSISLWDRHIGHAVDVTFENMVGWEYFRMSVEELANNQICETFIPTKYCLALSKKSLVMNRRDITVHLNMFGATTVQTWRGRISFLKMTALFRRWSEVKVLSRQIEVAKHCTKLLWCSTETPKPQFKAWTRMEPTNFHQLVLNGIDSK